MIGVRDTRSISRNRSLAYVSNSWTRRWSSKMSFSLNARSNSPRAIQMMAISNTRLGSRPINTNQSVNRPAMLCGSREARDFIVAPRWLRETSGKRDERQRRIGRDRQLLSYRAKLPPTFAI